MRQSAPAGAQAGRARSARSGTSPDCQRRIQDIRVPGLGSVRAMLAAAEPPRKADAGVSACRSSASMYSCAQLSGASLRDRRHTSVARRARLFAFRFVRPARSRRCAPTRPAPSTREWQSGAQLPRATAAPLLSSEKIALEELFARQHGGLAALLDADHAAGDARLELDQHALCVGVARLLAGSLLSATVSIHIAQVPPYELPALGSPNDLSHRRCPWCAVVLGGPLGVH